MRFKLDENLGPSVKALFAGRGLDCLTVREESLGGAPDEEVLRASVAEGRVLVTTDHDFGNVLQYPPASTAGIAVLSPPGRAARAMLVRLAQTLLAALESGAIGGKLWIVEPGRIRVHEVEREE
ncbi:MAG: DUF5615 family PIN-like protein [Deltaproteobacteria bacterium]|nr:DUF5615 family PIN-like protein [Deltaproteobacteria bacterium]